MPEYASTEINLNELKNAEEMEVAAEKLEKAWKEQGQEEGKTLDANGKMTEIIWMWEFICRLQKNRTVRSSFSDIGICSGFSGWENEL